MIKRFNANQARLKRHRRMRSRLEGSHDQPRLNIYRSGMHIYAQIIDDTTGQTLAAASSLDEALRNFTLEKKATSAAESKKEALLEEAPVEMAAEVAPAKGMAPERKRLLQRALSLRRELPVRGANLLRKSKPSFPAQ